MPARRLLAILTAAVLATCAAPAAAQGATAKRCGAERSQSAGQVFAVRAQRAGCKTARQVAGAWFAGGQKRKVADGAGRTWSCRITKRATGTDPGLNPYTHIRCARRTSVVRFKLRS